MLLEQNIILLAMKCYYLLRVVTGFMDICFLQNKYILFHLIIILWQYLFQPNLDTKMCSPSVKMAVLMVGRTGIWSWLSSVKRQ